MEKAKLILHDLIDQARTLQLNSFVLYGGIAAAFSLSSVFSLYLLKRQFNSSKQLVSDKKAYSLDNPEVIIVGGGVAGSTLALQLGRQGRYVVVIERDLSEPDRIVGEFLQPRGFVCLKQLGMEDCLDGIDAQVTHGYEIYKSKDVSLTLPFPVDKETKKKHEGRAFNNGKFIMNIREACKKYPNIKFIEGNVTGLIEDQKRVKGVVYTSNSESYSLEAPLTFVCDGCFSKFRNYVNSKKQDKTISSYFAGVLLHNLKLPNEGHGHVFLIEPTPTLLYRTSPDHVRALIDIPNPQPQDAKAYVKEVVVPQLPTVIQEAVLSSIDLPDNFKMMPNYKLHPSPIIRQGVIGIGDSFNIRHPLTGGGMTVLFNDVLLLTKELSGIVDFDDHKEVAKAYKEFFKKRKPLATTINILAQALYRVFGQGSSDPFISKVIREACFGYFELGGECVNGPMSLLSGIIESPSVLLYHYTCVGLYAAWHMKFKPITFLRVLYTATSIFAPLLYKEGRSKYVYYK